jgi:hypothetical protein
MGMNLAMILIAEQNFKKKGNEKTKKKFQQNLKEVISKHHKRISTSHTTI